jgi:hypothetical protein
LNKNGWNVELLRFTGFLTPNVQIGEPSWWEDIIGEKSETKLYQSKKGQFQEKGLLDDGEFILRIEPFRIDWIFRVIKDQDENIKSSLGIFKDVVNSFLLLMEKWFLMDKLPTLQRIAFGAVIFQPVENRKSGYERLSKYLSESVRLDPDSSSDFIYQINRPRKSKLKIPDLSINRLTRWSVQKYRLVGIAIESESKTIYEGQENFTCRLELDINTIPNSATNFDVDKYKNIFKELTNLGIEISEKGDIK